MNEKIIEYWKIGTSPISMIETFIEFLNKGIQITENFRILWNEKENWIVDSFDKKIFNLNSDSKTKQHLIAWKSLGFIDEKKKDYYSIITKFKKLNELIEYSKLFIKRKSNDKKINRYRNMIIINILVYLNIFSKKDIENKNIKKIKGHLITIQKIKSIISDYERTLSKDHNFINEILSIVIKKNLGKIIFL